MEVMECFLSKNNILRHKEHIKTVRSKLSIIEKSCPEITNINIDALERMRIDRNIKAEVIYLHKYISAHELFFDSFSANVGKCTKLKVAICSKERFLYEILEKAKESDGGFAFVYINKRQIPCIDISKDLVKTFSAYTPILALDLCEHAYFTDYGFDLEKYIKNALVYFNLNVIEANLT